MVRPSTDKLRLWSSYVPGHTGDVTARAPTISLASPLPTGEHARTDRTSISLPASLRTISRSSWVVPPRTPEAASAHSIRHCDGSDGPIMLHGSMIRRVSWIISIIHEKCRRFQLMNQPLLPREEGRRYGSVRRCADATRLWSRPLAMKVASTQNAVRLPEIYAPNTVTGNNVGDKTGSASRPARPDRSDQTHDAATSGESPSTQHAL